VCWEQAKISSADGAKKAGLEEGKGTVDSTGQEGRCTCHFILFFLS
jgi:hypothetical protein